MSGKFSSNLKNTKCLDKMKERKKEWEKERKRERLTNPWIKLDDSFGGGIAQLQCKTGEQTDLM